MDLLPVLITAAIVSILWFAYIKFSKKNNDPSAELDDLKKDKDHEIELLISNNEKELSVLREKLNSLETEKNSLKETLTKERETTAKQLETLGKVDAFKTSVTTNMGEYSQMIEKQQKFIDKLTGNAKYQGDFGERFLEQSLNFHGFKLGIDYTKQKKEEVYNLEEDKSQTTKFVNAENDEEKNDQFKRHYQAVKKHIDDLSKKDYMKNLKKEVFQKVIMYMCHEAAYLSALEHDPTLYDYAYKKNILLVGPKNLLAIISIVQTIRDKEKQINSVAEITQTASNLMEKYSLLKGHLIKAMTSFNSHGENLKRVINGAYQGRNSLEQRIEKLKDLGISSSTPIPKTTPLQDKLMDFEEVKDKSEDEKKEPIKKIYG